MLFTEDHTDGWTGGSVVWAVMGVNMALSASFDDFAARRVTLTSFLSRQRRGGKTPLPACAFPIVYIIRANKLSNEVRSWKSTDHHPRL